MDCWYGILPSRKTFSFLNCCIYTYSLFFIPYSTVQLCKRKRRKAFTTTRWRKKRVTIRTLKGIIACYFRQYTVECCRLWQVACVDFRIVSFKIAPLGSRTPPTSIHDKYSIYLVNYGKNKPWLRVRFDSSALRTLYLRLSLFI